MDEPAAEPHTRDGSTMIETLATPRTQLHDGFRRAITYLRVSITDRCNLRCVYCMPADFADWKPREHLLSYEEIVRVVRVAQRMGVRKVRITGGEPLVRRDCVELITRLGELGLEELCLTTNGLRFAEHAAALAAGGLTRVNISLDTLDADKFRAITRGGQIERVHQAIDAALTLELEPRLNVVAMAGFNDDELESFAALTLRRPLTVRFIEVMPFAVATDPELLGAAVDKPIDCESRTIEPIPLEAIRRRLGLPEQLQLSHGAGELPVLNTLGPAEYVRLPGAQGEIGFIASMHRHICERCNRVRMTADGFLKPCLLGDERVFVRDAARYGSEDDIAAAFEALMRIKPEHGIRDSRRPEAMSMIGG